VSETPTQETPDDAAAEPEPERHGVGRVVRWIVAMLVCVLAVVAVTGAVAAYYARLELLDTQQFTDRTAVIAEDEEVQANVSKLVSAKIIDAIDVDRITQEASGWVGVEDPPEAIRELVASAAESIKGYIESEVDEFVASPAFVEVWNTAVSEAHSSLVSALRGENSGALTADGNTLTLDLGRVVEVVKERLVEADFTLAADVPAVEAEYVLLDSEQVPQLQRDTDRLEWAADWLPWIALALLIIAFVLAPRRWVAALVVGVLGAILAGGAIWALGEGRTVFVNRAHDAAFAPLTYDAFTDSLRSTYTWMLVIAAALAVMAAAILFLRRRKAAA
jgi:hypothetical protein